MGVSFSVIPQGVEEYPNDSESPETFVSRLALEKATDGFIRCDQDQPLIPVLGADTIVVLNGQILGKPKDQQQGIDMLLSLSDQTHQVFTAVTLKNSQYTQQILSVSDVSFAPLSEQMCQQYWLTGEPIDKAGGYGIQGLGAMFVRHISGSYSGVMGLPIYETHQLLKKFAIMTVV
jgi:septum formation protein